MGYYAFHINVEPHFSYISGQATSDVPYSELPFNVREFFRSYQSSCSQPASSVQTVPRVSVQIEGKFNHEVMINLSTVELMTNVIEQLIQMVHKKSHVHVTRKGDITYDSVQGFQDRACLGKDYGSVSGDKLKVQLPEPFTKVPSPTSSRPMKQKSALLLGISTFGYQIIRFPHFAELCWVTSKLKEGPSADVSGPWKGWPFNSCIIRPNTLQDKLANSCSSSNIKNKEKSAIVRGLLAVGLSAYRGAYTSAREVSSELRKVFEILVEKINTKVQAGKDRYQFLRILSQVAYLEDMVNNWAYTLTRYYFLSSIIIQHCLISIYFVMSLDLAFLIIIPTISVLSKTLLRWQQNLHRLLLDH